MMKRAPLVGLLIALLGGCASWHRLGTEIVTTPYGVQVSTSDGFPGQFFLDIVNTGADSIDLKLGSYPVVIAEFSTSAVDRVGEVDAEDCDEDGVCLTETISVYGETEEIVTVKGMVIIEPESLTLGVGESATCAVTLDNYRLADKRFMLRIHTLVVSNAGRERSILSVPGELFSGGGLETW
jgi:hypothetical protein